jgi:acylglycerol lipase
MIAIPAVLSNLRVARRLAAALLAAPLLLGGCAVAPVSHTWGVPGPVTASFVMADGTRLGYRVWRPAGPPRAVVLALHGMNDSRDAWEVPGPAFAAAGIEMIAPDQRGFGSTEERGLWPGTAALVGDARRMVALIHEEYPDAKLYVMGESMGGAVAICLAASSPSVPIDGTILVAPAVWGRDEMNVFERAGLWLMVHVVPEMRVTGSIVHVTASDNRAAIWRLSTDPLTLHGTRWDAVKGLVDLMDAAEAGIGRIRGPVLFMYGGKDDLIPKRAARAAWRKLPEGVRAAYYPAAYHLMLRDHARAVPIEDVIAWMDDPAAKLPSGAEGAARAWLAETVREVISSPVLSSFQGGLEAG